MYEDRNGRLIASIRVNGKQHLKRVKTQEQAQEWFLCIQTQSIQAAQLTYQELTDAAQALTMLRKAGATLTLHEAITEWLNGHSSASQSKQCTFREAITEYLTRSTTRVSIKTLKDYKLMLNKFMDIVGPENNVGSFARPDAIRFLDRFNDKPPTWMAYKRALSRFFTECTRMEWATQNPFSDLDKVKVKPPKREFLSIEDTKTALQSVMKRQPKLLHFLTLGLFAGIRPIESLRLTAQHINLKTGYIMLSGDITKSHSYKERVVPITDTLRAWLNAYPFEGKPIPAANIGMVSKALKKCAEQDGWSRSPDCFRHSFATYRFALTNNSAETAAICGHSEDIAMKHYRGRVTHDEAIKYFDIVPQVC